MGTFRVRVRIGFRLRVRVRGRDVKPGVRSGFGLLA